MSVKSTARRQYQSIVDTTGQRGREISLPREGWIRTVRNALGMSGAQLAVRMSLTRARIAQMEKAELKGAVTLKSMELAAQAMGCRFVYAIVPSAPVEDLIKAQARKKAEALVKLAGGHMALENQLPSETAREHEIARLTRRLFEEVPSDLWNDK